MTIFPVVLSGGVGSRLWPSSRAAHPKQLHALISDKTMLQETVLRARTALTELSAAADPIIVCNAKHVAAIEKQLEAIDAPEHLMITEPEGRNTAPAAALAALLASDQDPEAVLIILPADHHIRDQGAFANAVERAVALARQGRVVTYGIVPDRAETGYGYIRRGTAIEATADSFAVAQFVEKPKKDVAESYVASGDYYWNGGIFTVRSDILLQEMTAHCPEIVEACRAAMAQAKRTNRVVAPDAAIFRGCPSDSIDYAVMERTDRAAVVAADMGWSDVGSWTALHEISPKDGAGNVVSGDVVTVDAQNNLIRSESRLVTVAGVRDLVIVETGDALLVTTLDQAQQVKEIVTVLKDGKRDEL